MAAKQVLSSLEGALLLNLSAVHPVDDFNQRADLQLGELVPQITVRGKVVVPVNVYKDSSGYALINGHRRHAALTLIKAIQAEEINKDETRDKYGLSATAFDNALSSEVAFVLPAIVSDKGSQWSRRLESIMANSGKALAPIEQARELLELKQMTLEDFCELTGKELKDGRTLASKVLNKDLAQLTGFTESHISQRLALVEQRTDSEQEKIRALVEKAVSDKVLNSNDARTVLKAKTMEEATASVKALVEATKSAKTKKGQKDTTTSPPVVPTVPPAPLQNAPVVAPPVLTTPSARQDAELLIGILSRQGLDFVADLCDKYAVQKKISVPWVRK